MSVVHNEKDAEDLAQDTFIKMMGALSTYRSQGFKTWISRIALHQAIDYKRKKQRQKEDLTFFDQEILPQIYKNQVEEEVLENEKIKHVQESLNQLPEKLQLVVHYYYLEDLSYKQIAEKLQVGESTIKMRLYRARKWMKKHWKKEDF